MFSEGARQQDAARPAPDADGIWRDSSARPNARTDGNSPNSVANGIRAVFSAAWTRRIGMPREVRDEVRRYVVDHPGQPSGLLIVDETGSLKKGAKSAGVARQ